MSRYLIIIIILLLNVNLGYAQEALVAKKAVNTCCSSDLINLFHLEHSESVIERQEIDDKILEYTIANQGMLKVGSDDNITIPVVFHIIHPPNTPIGTNSNIDDTQVHLAVQQINEAFSNTGEYYSPNGHDTGFDFCLAKKNPQGLPSSGINRMASATYSSVQAQTEEPEIKENTIQWDSNNYLNIWVVEEVCFGSNCAIGGYSYQAETHGTIYDGIVIEDTYVGGNFQFSKILIHEIGHYLDLYHPFEDGCTNNNCLTDNDKVCDTPPENSQLAHVCDAVPNSCSTDDDDLSINNPFRPISFGGQGDQDDLIENYMDYGYLNCRNSFTLGQIQRMQISFNTFRTSLLNSNACTVEDNIPVDIDACTPPEFTHNNSLGSTTANIGWSEVEDADLYSIEYRIVGSSAIKYATTSGTQITLNNLTPSSNYVYNLRSFCNGSASSNFAIDYFATTALESCNSPSNLNISNITPSSAQITWSVVPGASNYTLSIKEGNNPWQDYTVTTNSKFFNDLNEGTVYRVKVTATCELQNSAASNTITFNTPVTEQINCVPPTGISISYIGTNTAFVSWNAVADADTYMIGYKEENEDNWTYEETTNNQFTLIGLNDNTNYLIQLVSICDDETAYGTTNYSFTTLEDESIQICPLPTNLQVYNIMPNSAFLDWATVNEASSYVLYIRKNGENWMPSNANESSYQANNLSPDTYYQFKVYAVCSGTSGEFSSIYGFTTSSEVIECNAPENLTATNVNVNNATISWEDNPTAILYKLAIRKFGTSAWTNHTTTDNNFTFNNLDEATSYVILASAVCDGFESGEYTSITFLTNESVVEPCNAPQTISVTNVGEQSASFSWQGAANVDNYFLYVRELNQAWTTYNITATQYSINNLQEATTYQARIAAICDGVSSTFSDIITFTTNQSVIETNNDNTCQSPTGLGVNNITTNSGMANWNINGNAAFYIIGITESGVENGWEFKIISSDTHSFTGLKENTSYTIKIRSMCDGFAGDFSNEYQFTTSSNSNTQTDSEDNTQAEEEDICLYPTGIGVTNTAGTSATIFWNDNSKANQYILFIKSEDNSIPTIQYSYENQYEALDLTPNTNYDVRIKSICELGISDNSPLFSFNSGNINTEEEIEEETPPNPPSICLPPTDLDIVTLGSNMIQVDWSSQANAAFYQAELYKDDILEKTTTITGTTATFNEINTNANLKVRVRSYCGESWSSYSEFKTIATQTETQSCGIPTNLASGGVGDTYATLSWNAVPEAYYYELKVWQKGYPNIVQNYEVNGTVRYISILTNCTEYEWRLRAICPSGKGEYSATLSFTTSCSISVCSAEGLSTSQGHIIQVKVGAEGIISEDDGGYGEYLSSSFTLNTGSSNTFEMKSSTENPFYWGIWIDRNEDGNFDKYNERVYISTTPRFGTCAGFITISPDAITQTTTMRVIMSSNSDIDPCEDFESGEVEDYSIQIVE